MLSSDVLEQQFGETHVVILKQDNLHRIIKTIQTQNNETLELSLVTFDQHTTPFPDIHQRITDGISMGKAYAQAGISFTRKVNTISRVLLPPDLGSHFSIDKPATIIDVDIFVGDAPTHYCHILEVYSPAVYWPQPPQGTDDKHVFKALKNFSELLSS